MYCAIYIYYNFSLNTWVTWFLKNNTSWDQASTLFSGAKSKLLFRPQCGESSRALLWLEHPPLSGFSHFNLHQYWGFHKWGSPIAAWFIRDNLNIPSRNGWFGSTPILGNPLKKGHSKTCMLMFPGTPWEDPDKEMKCSPRTVEQVLPAYHGYDVMICGGYVKTMLLPSVAP